MSGPAQRTKKRKPAAWLKEGALVDYCSIIGEPPTEFNMTVRWGPQKMASGHWVVWLIGKPGCVAVEACVKPTKPLQCKGESAGFRWVGPNQSDLESDNSLKKPVPPEQWPYGPPAFHESSCLLHSSGLYCDCKASEADDRDYGVTP